MAGNPTKTCKKMPTYFNCDNTNKRSANKVLKNFFLKLQKKKEKREKLVYFRGWWWSETIFA